MLITYGLFMAMHLVKKWDEETLSYAAGFLDGEGCFSVDHRWKIVVSCANTNKPAIEWFKATFGGSMTRMAPRKANHRAVYSWVVVARDAERLCSAIIIYLKQKAEQALLLLAIQQTMNRGQLKYHKVPEWLADERNRLASMVKKQKKLVWE